MKSTLKIKNNSMTLSFDFEGDRVAANAGLTVGKDVAILWEGVNAYLVVGHFIKSKDFGLLTFGQQNVVNAMHKELAKGYSSATVEVSLSAG